MTTAPRTPPSRRHPIPPVRRPHSPAARRRARLRRNLRLLRTLVAVFLLVWVGAWLYGRESDKTPEVTPPKPRVLAQEREERDGDDGVKIGTFLGGAQRRYYGKGPVPEKLDVVWKARLGSGWTSKKENDEPVVWAGAGWTGQPTLVRDKGKLSLLVNSYDHKLHRYDAATGDTIWEYVFDDVIKSTNTVFPNPHPSGKDDAFIVAAGSRRGFQKRLGDGGIAPFRAVAFGTGRELWRLPVPQTKNYSRDVDASGLLVGKALFQPVESGYVYKLAPTRTKPWGDERQPVVIARSRELWDPADVKSHGGEPGGSNLCLEASPAFDAGRLYVSAGSGHVYALDPEDLKVTWDFKIGSDLDGTPVVRRDGKLFIPVERQYVKHGGVYLLDPSKPPKDAVVWWFPTQDRGLSEWAGGVVGSVAINDSYDADGTRPALAAFNSVDGNFYLVAQDELAPGKAEGPHGEQLPRPKLLFKADIGGSISTPIMVDDHIVTAGYDNKVHVFRVDYSSKEHRGSGGTWLRSRNGGKWYARVSEVASFKAEGPFEATPIVWKGRMYIACRDGYLYCLGDKRQRAAEMDGTAVGGD